MDKECQLWNPVHFELEEGDVGLLEDENCLDLFQVF
jgi:hypothetical protein